MLRIALLLAGLGLALQGGLLWMERQDAGNNPPVTHTIEEVLKLRPTGSGPRWNDPSLRIVGVELERDRAQSTPNHEDQFYVPVKDSEGRLWLSIDRAELPASGPITVIGSVMDQMISGVPAELAEQLDAGRLHVVYVRNASYRQFQRKIARRYFIVAAIPLGLAAILQAAAAAGQLHDRRRASQSMKLATVPAGPCMTCGLESERIAVRVNAVKRRVVNPWIRRDTSVWTDGDVCPKCHRQLEKLWRVGVVGATVGPLLLFVGVAGLVFLFIEPLGGLATLAVVVALFLLLQFWINRRYARILGPLAGELKREAGITVWNPLSDRIEFRLR